MVFAENKRELNYYLALLIEVFRVKKKKKKEKKHNKNITDDNGYSSSQ